MEKGKITNFKIYGDFFGKEPVEILEKLLIGARDEKSEIARLLKPIIIEDFFGLLPKNDYLEFILGDDEYPGEDTI